MIYVTHDTIFLPNKTWYWEALRHDVGTQWHIICVTHDMCDITWYCYAMTLEMCDTWHDVYIATHLDARWDMQHDMQHVASPQRASTHMHESWQIYVWVMAHICTSHVTHMHESCHTYARVMSHICMSHVTHMHESCHTYAWVLVHTQMSHVTLAFTYEWVMSHWYWHTNESCHEWVMSRMTL